MNKLNFSLSEINIFFIWGIKAQMYMFSPITLSSNLSWVQASYAEATVPGEIYFLALFLQIIARTRKNKTIKKKGNNNSNI